jgi:hypothetical protein
MAARGRVRYCLACPAGLQGIKGRALKLNWAEPGAQHGRVEGYLCEIHGRAAIEALITESYRQTKARNDANTRVIRIQDRRHA